MIRGFPNGETHRLTAVSSAPIHKADEANLASANAIVDAGVVCGQCGITSCRSAALAKTTAELWEASTVAPNVARLLTTDPTWSPSGKFLVYSGADVGTTFPVKAIGADGSLHSVPNLVLTRGARRLVFLGENTLAVMKGDISHQEFWSVDLNTGRERQLTALRRGFVISDFDVSSDGREIIFDRTRDESDIALFDLPNR